jgi:hypothetical protein
MEDRSKVGPNFGEKMYDRQMAHFFIPKLPCNVLIYGTQPVLAVSLRQVVAGGVGGGSVHKGVTHCRLAPKVLQGFNANALNLFCSALLL